MYRPHSDHPGSRPRSLGLTGTMALVAVALLLAACGSDGGGGGGGGGGTPSTFLHALIVNASDVDITVGYSADGEPEPDQVVPTCTAANIDYPLADPFELFVDGATVIDTFEDLPEGLPNDGESDLIVEVKIGKDGTVNLMGQNNVPVPADVAVRPGRGIPKPSKSAFCPTLPG
ncbi:MAG TPA: hypothetical protein VII26_02215 [Candidatus Limnocylindria bacterium]